MEFLISSFLRQRGKKIQGFKISSPVISKTTKLISSSHLNRWSYESRNYKLKCHSIKMKKNCLCHFQYRTFFQITQYTLYLEYCKFSRFYLTKIYDHFVKQNKFIDDYSQFTQGSKRQKKETMSHSRMVAFLIRMRYIKTIR